MTLLATFKHISSKNADYGAAEQYLTFEHDEFTMKPTLDENGRLMLREDYRIATLNCGDEDFAVACMRSNLRYGKNQKREDVKSHHYIISFDPRDAVDNGLTVDRAQALGEEFCRKQFPGHQAIVCTHPDGHNHSGNIHVHIVINSLRIAEVPFLPYMDRPADTRAGCKHRCTDAAMEYFKAEVMELCHRENLYQIDLLHGSKNRITEHVTCDLLYDEHTNKQFITVQTSGGNTFYIVIDYDKPVDEEGEQYETYFLNVVDEADLLAAAEAAGVEQAVCSCSEKCAAGAVNTDCAVCSVNISKCVGIEPEPTETEEPAPEEAEPETGGNAGMLLAVLAVALVGGGAAFYFKVLRPKQQQAGEPEDDYGEEDYEDDGPPWDEDEENSEEDEE